MKKILFLIAGFLLLGLGFVGIALPVLPTTPFVLAASFCFVKSSSRMHRWIMANRFFGPRIERLQNGKGLTKKEKLITVSVASAFILLAMVMMHSLHLRIFLAVLLVVKYFVFWRVIPTAKPAPVTGVPDA
ncbi:MAG: YbaN family protein [Treponema sp.]|nr:YbaN family protein [Treponema sp.]